MRQTTNKGMNPTHSHGSQSIARSERNKKIKRETPQHVKREKQQTTRQEQRMDESCCFAVLSTQQKASSMFALFPFFLFCSLSLPSPFLFARPPFRGVEGAQSHTTTHAVVMRAHHGCSEGKRHHSDVLVVLRARCVQL